MEYPGTSARLLAGVGCGSLKWPVVACLTLGLSREMNGVTQRELSFLLLLWGLSDPRIAEPREMLQSFSIKLHSENQVSGHLGMSGGRSPRHAQNPLLGERRKTLSITHHALSPPPSHHLYIIHLINWLQRFFYRNTMSLKRPFVPKSGVKQWFKLLLDDIYRLHFLQGVFLS